MLCNIYISRKRKKERRNIKKQTRLEKSRKEDEEEVRVRARVCVARRRCMAIPTNSAVHVKAVGISTPPKFFTF